MSGVKVVGLTNEAGEQEVQQNEEEAQQPEEQEQELEIQSGRASNKRRDPRD